MTKIAKAHGKKSTNKQTSQTQLIINHDKLKWREISFKEFRKKVRDRTGLTDEQRAAKLGISVSTLYNYDKKLWEQKVYLEW